ncbi:MULTISPECIES: tyrosine--tRNA ligase [Pelosinus]|uniref:Tyrosine--tRNA ligase n=1 Tax=Pelosinus fermentans B4 TaxID=1149862 RepID=I9LB57_9FIRM|nr:MULTISPECIES: tyrosine--tRNA ligase [Pelosinus]EIW17664.1 tyrosyl-tRNA synthetase [Pelosinus fermentans B4]EIW23625.1 Tyrosyl-tRNA synthetase [Pelosinus fermentans A11]OAM94550.1 Tyrosyl-tRNA synthetase [Pelosinus fermentans DSM 17108]SDR12037.1 tyrosyl-tRNA synthetase [Pelosinus fermentans]
MTVLDILKERGFIQQLTHEDEIIELFEKEKITFYIGFDPTADSLHVGHFLGMMVMAHMQKAGHRPVCLIGGGTTMVGDPSGKTDMRKMMTQEDIVYNGERFKKQMQRFIDFSEDKALLVNNADWLLKLNYIEFLRDIGAHFSVNRMLTAECFKQRLDKGLSFLEFNYMLMQAYDFLELNRQYNCIMQMGGDDQWSNILAGADLIRRKESKPAYGLTFTLLTTSDGRKMGKTEKGALWLDAEKTSPYTFYQYWRNIDDADVEKCLALLTFMPMDEVRKLGALKDKEINIAKKVLAFEVTKLIHGAEEAEKAQQAAEALFNGAGALDNVPTVSITSNMMGMKVLDVLAATKIVPSKSEGRRLIQQGGLYIGDTKVTDLDLTLTDDLFENKSLLVRKGKKNYHRIIVTL